MTEQFANFAQSTLSANISATQTTVTLQSLVNFPTSYPYRIAVSDGTNNEIMLVTGLASGTTINVTRSYEGGTASAFSVGAIAANVATAGIISALWNKSINNIYAPITRPANGGFDTATFSSYFPYSVVRDASGAIRSPDFDWRKWAPNVAYPALDSPGSNSSTTAVNAYFVATYGSDSNTGASWAQAFLTINKAITAGNAAAAPYTVYVAGGLYQNGATWGGASGTVIPSQTCAFIAVGGRVKNSQSALNSTYSWSLTSGTTYQMTRSKVQRAVALDLLDQWGDYTEYTWASSPVACEATPGSWYTDNTTTYINRLDGAMPTSTNTRMFFNTQVASQSTTSGNMYVQGFDFEGGENNVMSCKGNPTGRMVFDRCSFKWSSSGVPTTDINCGVFNVNGVAFLDCTCARGQGDNLASHALSGKVGFMLSINTHSHHAGNGTSGPTGGAASISNNAFTGHDSGRMMSINGNYHDCLGANVIPVLGAQNWSIGDASYSSQGDIPLGGTAYPASWATNQNSPSGTGNWIDSCVSTAGDNTSPSGGVYYDLYTDAFVGAGAANYYRNCNFPDGLGLNSIPY